ncbi:phage terminase large subunit family protein [Natrarchaeobaculum sulfurireducens]|uniref:Phage terminase large subunit n=1 Tax=Natrarchaeobaculum sulfurireducens TaxID=2044521 RepID=A0A346PHK2_9EURY|nr:hypothetical protein [Natrarchaeobaculum sulfurireducens]AXR78997.1 Phage terminase large subunit [Natrarchaeobaculum sulfurireducens]
MSQAADVMQIAERNPLAHPAIASIQLFDYSLPPGPHLKELYNALWKAVDPDFPYAATKIARLLPRGHGKSEGIGVVFPTWVILSYPDVRVAVISKTADLAAERTSKVVDAVEHWAPQFGIEIENAAGQQLNTAANTEKEPTISPYGLESQLTGKHFDVIVWDDIADWDNQRTAKQRRNVREYFRDYEKNLIDPDSVLECDGVQAMIGTRKHPQDIYETDILNSASWDARTYKAIAEEDWPLVEQRAWQVRGDDGEVYADVGDLPADVNLANNGVIPDEPMTVLWPEHKPAESLLYDIVDGDNTTPIWRRENQQDPHALSGEVFKSDWLTYVDELPKPRSSYEWYAGMDIGLVEDLQQAAEDDTDWTALAVIAWNADVERGYLTTLVRDRGMSVKESADWAEEHLEDVDVDQMLVEQNANRGVAQRLRDDSPIPAEGDSSSGDKEERIHNMAADFESSTLRIVGSPTDEEWRNFEVEEWLQFPNASHDDRLDAIEIAMRAVEYDDDTNSGSGTW